MTLYLELHERPLEMGVAFPNTNPNPPNTNFPAEESIAQFRFGVKSVKMKSKITPTFCCFPEEGPPPPGQACENLWTKAGKQAEIADSAPSKNFFTNTPSRLRLPAWAGWTF
jgi:hypothetical protein